MKTYMNELIQKIVNAGVTVPDQQIEIAVSDYQEMYGKITVGFDINDYYAVLNNLVITIDTESFRLGENHNSLSILWVRFNTDRVKTTREAGICKMKNTSTIICIIENLIVTDLII